MNKITFVFVLIFVLAQQSFGSVDIELKKKADNGDIDAQAKIAQYYFEPQYGQEDYSLAATYARRAIAGDSPLGEYIGARIMEKSYNPNDINNIEVIEFLYRDSAERGFADSNARLGWLYVNGIIFQKDIKNGLLLLNKSIEQNSALGLWYLSSCYALGIGVEKNLEKHMTYLIKAAEQKNENALYALGLAHAGGAYVKKDANLALHYFEEAAKKNEKNALLQVGLFYVGGIATKKDEVLGVSYILRAAEMCQPDAVYMTALSYSIGVGVPVNYVKAYAWSSVALSLGDKKTVGKTGDEIKNNLRSIEAKLSPQDLAMAQSLSEKYFEKCKNQ